MAPGVRRTIFFIYAFVALLAPLYVVLFPGQPPLQADEALLQVGDGAFVTPEKALGSGAESYELNVLHDLDDRLAGAAAVYPDGSSALIARFASPRAAQAAAAKLIEMIPHQAAMSDLWATRFQSDSGEFVVITTLDDLLVFIIADTEASASARLAALPALVYNDAPGFGAVLAREGFFAWLAWFVGYGLFQFITLSRLGSWVSKRTPAKGVTPASIEALRQALFALAERAPLKVLKLDGGDIEICWAPNEALRQSLKQRGEQRLQGLRLAFDDRGHVVRAQLQQAPFDSQTGVGDELLEGGETTLLGLAWERKIHLPLLAGEEAMAAPLDEGHALRYRSDELYAIVGQAVVAEGWIFRPVISFSRFVSG